MNFIQLSELQPGMGAKCIKRVLTITELTKQLIQRDNMTVPQSYKYP